MALVVCEEENISRAKAQRNPFETRQRFAPFLVLLDDGTDQTNPGPICVDSVATAVDPAAGEVLLSLRVNFGNTSDKIVVRALGLHLSPA